MTQPSDLPPSEIPIRARHIRAPQGDGEVLIEPSLRNAEHQLVQNRLNQDGSELRIANESHTQLANYARFELIKAAYEYSHQYRSFKPPRRSFSSDTPVVLSGHQPELFHPGVWLKNFVLDECRKIPNSVQPIQIPNRSKATVAINLVIDNDVAGNASIRTPSGSSMPPLVEEFPLDEPFANVPYEERPIVSSSMVKGFSARLQKQFQPRNWFEKEPAPALLAGRLAEYLEVPWKGKSTLPLGAAFARARHRLEEDFGLQTLELPLSHVAQMPIFRNFALNLLQNASRLREVYNSSLAEYRIVNKIRSNSHPVPELSTDGKWLEAPFWIWTKENPQRRRLFVCRDLAPDGKTALCLSDRQQVQDITILLSPNDSTAGVEQWQYLEETCGIKIRPRALITTMYARLFLSDLFIHGIGGAKYDELTDAIIRRFFGIEPPAFMTVTGTVRLPIPRPDVSAADVRSVKQLIREIRFHPEKFVNDASPALRDSATQFAAQKQELLRQHQFHFRGAAAEQFRALDDLNRQLSLLLTDVEIRLRDELKTTEQDYQTARILGSREFSFVLHPADTLPEQLKRMASS